MNIGPGTVQYLANAADAAVRYVNGQHGLDMTEDVFANHQYRRDPGHGAVHVGSFNRDKVWRGRGASKRAAAFYLGVADAHRGRAYLALPMRDSTLRTADASEDRWIREELAKSWDDLRLATEYGEGLDYANSQRTVALAKKNHGPRLLSPQARRRLDSALHGIEWEDLAAEVASALGVGEGDREVILAVLKGDHDT